MLRRPGDWRNGQMALRWCAAGMGEAAKQFRRVNGFLHLPALRAALEAHVSEAVTPQCDDDEVAALSITGPPRDPGAAKLLQILIRIQTSPTSAVHHPSRG